MYIAICDDDITYLNYLYKLIKPLMPDANLKAISPEELYKQICNQTFPYDIVITDIDMGELNGIQLAMKINQLNPSCIIIFISNYLNYATEVYDVNHIYFVLKAEATIRLPKALEKAQAVISDRKSKLLKISYQKTDYLIPILDIIYLEAMGRYVYIHTMEQEYRYIRSLKDILPELSDEFVRCHNSYIINLNYVQSINRTKCELIKGISIPISITYSRKLYAAYVSFISNSLG